jgi:hypothetical protein
MNQSGAIILLPVRVHYPVMNMAVTWDHSFYWRDRSEIILPVRFVSFFGEFSWIRYWCTDTSKNWCRGLINFVSLPPAHVAGGSGWLAPIRTSNFPRPWGYLPFHYRVSIVKQYRSKFFQTYVSSYNWEVQKNGFVWTTNWQYILANKVFSFLLYFI